MIFGREREAVRNATRAIRDLVLRRELGGGGGLGGGLSAMAMMAVAPLRQLPELATQVPGTLRDLGERMTAIPSARRRAPALAFAAQALAGSVRYGATLRERYLNLLAASMDSDKAGRVHPAFLEVLRQLTADEARIISQFQHDGPYPLVSVGARYKFGAVRFAGDFNFTLSRMAEKSFRSSAASMLSGDVPMMFTPLAFSACADAHDAEFVRPRAVGLAHARVRLAGEADYRAGNRALSAAGTSGSTGPPHAVGA